MPVVGFHEMNRVTVDREAQVIGDGMMIMVENTHFDIVRCGRIDCAWEAMRFWIS